MEETLDLKRLDFKILKYMSVDIKALKKDDLIEHLYNNLKNYNDFKIDNGRKISKEDITTSLDGLLTKGLLCKDTNDDEIGIDTKAVDYLFEEQYSRIEKIERLSNDAKSNFKNMNNRINDFNKNIITIMSLLIGAFSIIGFNIGGIKFIVSNNETLPINEYVLSIIIINVSIVVSLYFLFFLLNRMLNQSSNIKQSKTFGALGFTVVSLLVIIFIVLIFICSKL